MEVKSQKLKVKSWQIR